MRYASVLVTALVASACSAASNAEPSAPAVPGPSQAASADARPSLAEAEANAQVNQFVSLLRQSVSYDYDPHESPADLRDDSDVVVVGHFGEVREGRSIEGIGQHAWVTVDVEHVLAGSDQAIVGGKLTLELVTSAGGTLADYRESMPEVRVLLFLDERTHVEGIAASREPVFALQSPMGLILENGSRFLGGYEDLGTAGPEWAQTLTFDEFVRAIEG